MSQELGHLTVYMTNLLGYTYMNFSTLLKEKHDLPWGKESDPFKWFTPENNCPPIEQRAFIQEILNKVRNTNNNYYIYTHSDYMIKEINNQIMADAHKRVGNDFSKLTESIPLECISMNYIHYINNCELAVYELVPDKFYGFSVKHMDDVINDQNRISKRLALGIL
jgi:hypothetical protein